jgi:photosystem II stability/assembly factor-like uncharacterized protein
MARRLRVVMGLVLALGMLGASPGSASSASYENLPGWNWRGGGTLQGVDFAGDTLGWAVGDGGLIIHSADGGVTWQPQASQTNLSLCDVQFLDSDHGWAVGDGGVIVATDDGGDTWNVQSTPTSAVLYGVHFVNASTGWAVGDGGTILITQNGGIQWLSQTSNTAESLYGVDFVDGTHGWAVGADGTVIATTDGGLIWNDQPSCDEIHDLYDVDFVDQNNGWIVGWGSALWTTSDGGTNWGEWILSGWTRDLYALELTDAHHGWAVGAGGFVARYEYPSWTEQTSGVDVSLCDLDFVDGQRGWAVGDAGTGLSTSDGGDTWVRRIGSTVMTVNGLYFIDENRGWAAAGAYVAGFPGELLYTSDSGATWVVQESEVPYLNDVQFVTQYRGWAVGGRSGDGTILATTDGGAHWAAQTYPISSGPMRGVHFVSPDDGWAVGGAIGGNGWILNTTNGGNDWTLQKYITDSGCLYDVCFSDFTHGWAVGVNGNIWATVNGSDWFTQTSGMTETLSSLYCYDQLAWAVGGSAILATRDGGDTWFAQDSGHPNATFFDVDFSGPAWGWVVGVDGSGEYLILVTGDQGVTWLPEEMPISAPLASVHAFRRGRGPVIWAGGSRGLVLSNYPDPTIPVPGTVTPAEGGAIFPSDGSTSLIFPAGAVTATTTVTYTPKTASQMPSTGDLTGLRIFDLTAVYSGTTIPASLAPGTYYTITASYLGAVVVEDARLGLYHWSGSAWVKEPTSSADWDKDIVMANPDHFSYFAALGKSHRVYLPVVLKNYL